MWGTLQDDLEITAGRRAIDARVLDVRTASEDMPWFRKYMSVPGGLKTRLGTTYDYRDTETSL